MANLSRNRLTSNKGESPLSLENKMITMTKLTALASTLYKLVDQYYILTGQNVNPNTDLRKYLKPFLKTVKTLKTSAGLFLA